MMLRIATGLLACLLGLTATSMTRQATAQERAGSWAWKPLLQHEGVSFKYIFYREADNEHDGVVIMLENSNDYPVTYRFKVIFRSDGAEVVEEVNGRLEAGQSKTGDRDGLFWIPFKDGRSIGEVGLRGYKIQRAQDPSRTRDPGGVVG